MLELTFRLTATCLFVLSVSSLPNSINNLRNEEGTDGDLEQWIIEDVEKSGEFSLNADLTSEDQPSKPTLGDVDTSSDNYLDPIFREDEVGTYSESFSDPIVKEAEVETYSESNLLPTIKKDEVESYSESYSDPTISADGKFEQSAIENGEMSGGFSLNTNLTSEDQPSKPTLHSESYLDPMLQEDGVESDVYSYVYTTFQQPQVETGSESESNPPVEESNSEIVWKERERLRLQNKMIAEAIRTENYTEADDQISMIGLDKTNFRQIVFELIFQGVNNFPMINGYSRNSSNPLIPLYLLGSYWSFVLSFNYRNLTELCDVYRTLEERVVNSKTINQTYIDYTEMHLRTYMGPFIGAFAAEQLSAALINGTIGMTEDEIHQILEISEKVLSLNESVYDFAVSGLDFTEIFDYYEILKISNETKSNSGLIMERYVLQQIVSTGVRETKIALSNEDYGKVEFIARKIFHLDGIIFDHILNSLELDEKLELYNALIDSNEIRRKITLNIQKYPVPAIKNVLMENNFEHLKKIVVVIFSSNPMYYDEFFPRLYDVFFEAS